MANKKRLIDVNPLMKDGWHLVKTGKSNVFIASMSLADVQTVEAVEVVRCRECKHLNVLNRKELYAQCPKTNTVFLPFKLDTREHFCSLGERKDGDGDG